MELLTSLLEALEKSALPTALRLSYLAYPLVNAAHILGLAMLFGAILPLDLRLLGLWRSVPVAPLARILLPVAISGLVLAISTGALLFSVGAVRYAGLGVFQVKMLLFAAAIVNALLLHRTFGWGDRLPAGGGISARVKFAAALSIPLWIAVVICGRMIAYNE